MKVFDLKKPMKRGMLALLASALVMAASACGPSSPIGDSHDGPTSTADLVYGCNWLFTSTSDNANFAYPETNAVYVVTAIPDTIPAADHIEISGQSPTARYFSFQIYSENGVAQAGANDAQIFGQSATPAKAISPEQNYTVTVVYSAAATSSGTTIAINPVDTSPRAPKHRFLLYRLYLPSGGAADFENLPKLTYVSAAGVRTPLGSAPDGPSCNQVFNNIQTEFTSPTASDQMSITAGLVGKPAIKPPRMTIFRSTTGSFQNLDVRYMSMKASSTLGDLLIVRGLVPTRPGFGQSPQVRYWSICSDQSHTTKVVACLADEQARTGLDGYYNVIIAASQPPGTDNDFDFLPFGPDSFGVPIYRQLLADPSFSESIDSNLLSPDPSLTMGPYFPATTYCSLSVFNANLSLGAPAVFSACKASQGIAVAPDVGG